MIVKTGSQGRCALLAVLLCVSTLAVAGAARSGPAGPGITSNASSAAANKSAMPAAMPANAASASGGANQPAQPPQSGAVDGSK